jgi:hypothetical protein
MIDKAEVNNSIQILLKDKLTKADKEKIKIVLKKIVDAKPVGYTYPQCAEYLTKQSSAKMQKEKDAFFNVPLYEGNE